MSAPVSISEWYYGSALAISSTDQTSSMIRMFMMSGLLSVYMILPSSPFL